MGTRPPSNAQSVGVVGAGPGGLAVACLLAAGGARVTVYEAQPTIGGRTGRVTLPARGGAFRFDRGPTFFMMPYVLEEIFASCGRRLTDYARCTRLDPMYRLLLGRPGERPLSLDATQDIAEMSRRIGAIDPEDGRALPRFMDDNRRKLRLMTPVLRSPIRSVLDLLNAESLKAATVINPHQSLYDHLRRYFRSPLVRLALSFQSKYLGMSPFECPSLFSILPFIEYEYGVWHPAGGCHALMAALAEVAGELGVEIVASTPVERLVFQGRRAVGVETSGARAGRFEHGQVVINADAPWAMKHLIPQSLRAGETDARIDARRYSCSTAMLYLGLDGSVDLPHHTIYTSADYRGNIDDISRRGRLSADPSMYVCNPGVTDPSMAPEGRTALYVLLPTPNCKAGIDWARERAVVRARAFAQLERVFGVEDLERRVLAEGMVTPDDWRASRINHGAVFSLAHTLGQMLHKRPRHRLPGVDGVWLVGGGTHPGSGLPVIFLSAQITARLLCAEAGLRDAGAGRKDMSRSWPVGPGGRSQPAPVGALVAT